MIIADHAELKFIIIIHSIEINISMFMTWLDVCVST